MVTDSPDTDHAAETESISSQEGGSSGDYIIIHPIDAGWQLGVNLTFSSRQEAAQAAAALLEEDRGPRAFNVGDPNSSRLAYDGMHIVLDPKFKCADDMWTKLQEAIEYATDGRITISKQA